MKLDSPYPDAKIPQLHGNTKGLKPSQVKTLTALYRRRVPQGRFLNPETARPLAEVSRALNRQVGLIIDRLGVVQKVIVGDAHQVFLPDLGRARAGASRLRGVRLVVTKLRGEDLSKDNLTDLSLLRLDAVIAVQAGMDGLPGRIDFAHLLPPGAEEGSFWHTDTVPSVHDWTTDFAAFILDLQAQFSRAWGAEEVGTQGRAIVIGVGLGDKLEAERSLAELERLAQTAGLHVVDQVLQHRRKRDGRYVIGKGKLQEILLRSMHLGAEVLVFDGELAPSQLRNIATETELKVLDRTQLILDIFSLRAKTREGKLQVELAQLRYRRPRLAVMPTAMSRLTGGIGGRGPGESRLEINRRRADERLARIKKELKKLGKHRAMRRERRRRVGLPLVSIVGYTNAGKSTLLNRMTHSKVDTADKLFATLDPTSRRLRFPKARAVILTDTVGFIRQLPKDLVEAFSSTLEEVVDADLLIHVIDGSSDEATVHAAAVEAVLDQLGVSETPVLRIINKIDAIEPELWPQLKVMHDALLCSARSGDGLPELLIALERRLFRARARQSTGA